MVTEKWSDFVFDSTIPFEEKAEAVLAYQLKNHPVYHTFFTTLGKKPGQLLSPRYIPLLPIRAFKMGQILVDGVSVDTVFRSSGTSSMDRSTHYVADIELYKKVIHTGFYSHFDQNKTALICYMPGYSDNKESSLIRMAVELINNDDSGLSTFFSEELNLEEWYHRVEQAGKVPVMFGAAFGLLDLIESRQAIPGTSWQIIETGGMKTFRREIPKAELRNRIADGFRVPLSSVHSEYGMCELLSQMYAISSEWFASPDWVQVTIRKPDDPLQVCDIGEEGLIGIIDLANVYSCPFILTEDRGVMRQNGEFRVLGRWNEQNPRGCNFLIDQE